SVGDVIRGSAKFLVPAVGEFMPDAGAKCQIVPEPHRIFRVPCSKPAAEAQLGGRRHHLEACRAQSALQKGRKAREVGHAQPARRRVFVVLHLLEPATETKLMSSAADLQAVGKRVEISAVPRAGRVVWTGGCDGGSSSCRRAAADDDSAGSLSADERKTRRIC